MKLGIALAACLVMLGAGYAAQRREAPKMAIEKLQPIGAKKERQSPALSSATAKGRTNPKMAIEK